MFRVSPRVAVVASHVAAFTTEFVFSKASNETVGWHIVVILAGNTARVVSTDVVYANEDEAAQRITELMFAWTKLMGEELPVIDAAK